VAHAIGVVEGGTADRTVCPHSPAILNLVLVLRDFVSDPPQMEADRCSIA
jgi:hypothetical protein